MQNLRVITGNRQEGKTNELLENYFLRYVTTFDVEVDDGLETKYFRDNVKLVYIDGLMEQPLESDTMFKMLEISDFSYLEKEDNLKVSDIAEKLECSIVTINKDIQYLKREYGR